MNGQVKPPSGVGRAWERLLVVALCGLIGWFYVWTATSNGDEWDFKREQEDYYNLLIDGWLDGQLHLKVPVPEALLKLPDPYDPALRPPDLGLHDASFYRGKYYLYFGAAPVVLLMLPYRLLTGCDMPQALAILVFAFGGFLASLAVWRAVRRRYFPETNAVVMLLGTAVLGIAGLEPMLMRRPHVWELPIAAGFAFAMLVLVAVWWSLHAETRRGRLAWFAAAGLFLGCAVASRPTYLLASPLLALPLFWWWHENRHEGNGTGLPWREVVAVVLPLGLVGALMAWHNYARFGDPLQFGQAYQFSLDYESKMEHFRARYVPFNLWRYFFSAARWLPSFPFIEPAVLPPKPPGFAGHDDVYGVLRNLPIAWLALVAPLALRQRTSTERGRLGAWLGAGGVLFAVMAGVLLVFFGSLGRYQLDFTPTLMLLAGVGLLVVERERRAWRMRSVRHAVCVAWVVGAVISVVFGILFSLAFDGRLRSRNPAREQQLARTWNWIPYALERVRGVRHGPVELTLQFPAGVEGERTLLTTGDPAVADRVFVRFLGNERMQLGFEQPGAPAIVSRPVTVEPGRRRVLRVALGSLFPADTHPIFRDASVEEVAGATRRARIELDGAALIDERRAFTPGAIAVHADARGLGAGELRRVGTAARLESRPTEFLRLRVTFPQSPTAAREPLVAVGDPTAGALIFVRYVDRNGQIAFGSATGSKVGGESEPVRVVTDRAHELLLRWWPAADATRRTIELRVEGTIVWAQEIGWGANGATPVVGKNVTAEPDCAPTFTGTCHQVQGGADGRDPLLAEFGNTLRLRMRLPFAPTAGAGDPLIVTGRTAAGDLLLVRYVDREHVRFALDHWGGGGGESAPIRIDFSKPHDLELQLPTLAPRAPKRPPRHDVRGRVRVRLDGSPVWDETMFFYTAAADELAIGRNPIGGTSCGPVFTGDILLAERIVRE